MKTKKTPVIFSFLIITVLIISQAVHAQGTIDVEFYGLENNKGKVILMLFNNEEGFPGKMDQAYQRLEVKIKDQKATAAFIDIPFGTYAVSAVHDENDNGEIEKNFMGMPKENVGMSGKSGGRPSFEKAAFVISQEETLQKLAFEPFKLFK